MKPEHSFFRRIKLYPALLGISIATVATLSSYTAFGDTNQSAPASLSVPTEIDVWIGSFGGQSNQFQGDGKSITLEVMTNTIQVMPSETHRELYRTEPTSEAWETFRLAIIDANLGNWDAKYIDPHVLDGTVWHVELQYPGWQKKTSGRNAWPKDDAFEALWAALLVLVDYPASKVE